jgi:hypothetical protein
LTLLVREGVRGWTSKVFGHGALEGLDYDAPKPMGDEATAKLWAIETAKKIFFDDLDQSAPDCLSSPAWTSPRPPWTSTV